MVAALVQRGDLVLIARRAPHKDQAGLWEFPGGKVEVGETPEAALHRELAEELDLRVEIGPPLAESRFERQGRRVTLIGYLCRFIQGGLTLRDHDAVEWVRSEDLSSFNLSPPDLPLAAALQGRQPGRTRS